MSGDVQLMLMIAGMHLLGLVCAVVLILPALRGGGPDLPPRGEHGSDDGWGHGPRKPTNPFNLPTGGLPLPDAIQSRVRLRDHRRLPDFVPRPERRPAREPAREPVRTPAR